MADIDPEAQSLLDRLAVGKPPNPEQHLSDGAFAAHYRDQLLQMIPLAGQPAGATSTHHVFEGPDRPLDLRVYRDREGALPGLVYFHGGGFVAGSLDTHDPALRSLAAATGAAVIAVDYRRAPEYPFPAAPEDCFATLDHVATNHARFGIDPARLVVAGDSAGGLLATVVAAMARDRGGLSLAGQICLYPNTDLRLDRSYPSMPAFDGNIVDLAELSRCITLYLSGADPAHRYASPVLAADLKGLPPALIVTCECDPLRDEGEAYADRLREAGVAVQHIRLPGMIHGALVMGGHLQAGRSLMATIGRWLDGEAT